MGASPGGSALPAGQIGVPAALTLTIWGRSGPYVSNKLATTNTITSLMGMSFTSASGRLRLRSSLQHSKPSIRRTTAEEGGNLKLQQAYLLFELAYP